MHRGKTSVIWRQSSALVVHCNTIGNSNRLHLDSFSVTGLWKRFLCPVAARGLQRTLTNLIPPTNGKHQVWGKKWQFYIQAILALASERELIFTPTFCSSGHWQCKMWSCRYPVKYNAAGKASDSWKAVWQQPAEHLCCPKLDWKKGPKLPTLCVTWKVT